MGEVGKDALRVNFDRELKLEFHGVKVTFSISVLYIARPSGIDKRL